MADAIYFNRRQNSFSFFTARNEGGTLSLIIRTLQHTGHPTSSAVLVNLRDNTLRRTSPIKRVRNAIALALSTQFRLRQVPRQSHLSDKNITFPTFFQLHDDYKCCIYEQLPKRKLLAQGPALCQRSRLYAGKSCSLTFESAYSGWKAARGARATLYCINFSRAQRFPNSRSNRREEIHFNSERGHGAQTFLSATQTHVNGRALRQVAPPCAFRDHLPIGSLRLLSLQKPRTEHH